MLFVMMTFVNAQQPAGNQQNPLLQQWNTPFQTPPFDKIKTEHYLPAFEVALKEAKEDIRRIDQLKQQPNFRNTVAALDAAGERLNAISNIFFNLNYCNTNPEMQQLAQKISPMLTEFSNDIYLNDHLFQRVKAVHDNPGTLNDEEKMLLDKTYRAFVRSGANLSAEDKEKFRKISLNLSTLSLQFNENVLASTNNFSKNITDKSELSGIPESALAIAAEKAKNKGMEGWLFDLSTPSYIAVMTYADNRKLREEFYMHYNQRAYNDEFDNQQIIKDILQNRYDMAQLLGYKNYAEYVLEERMAENVQNVYQLENELLEAAYPKMKEEIADLQAFAKANGLKGELKRWDFSYYSEKHKTSLYDINDEMLKPYFKLENVIDGVFKLAENLFELRFVENKKIPVYHPDVKAYEVYQYGDENFMAVLYLDFHPRDSKKGGAWMTTFRDQNKYRGIDVRPHVSLVMNFTPSTAESPSLLTIDEVSTFLHEFGHATHAMLSNVRYQSLSGTSVPRDFVELPSQLLENWVTEKGFLSTFAKHYETGEVIPDALIQKIKNVNNYHAAYACCRQLMYGLLDMMWHTNTPPTSEDIVKLEQSTIAHTEALPKTEGTCISTAFSHIFAGGYAAGYYGYKWAEVLDADAFSLFQERGIFNKDVALLYINNILSKGGTQKPMKLFVNFRGREPKIDALLKRSGLK